MKTKKEENKALRQLAKQALKSNDVCKDWRNKILECAPSLKETKLEVGKWYKNNKAVFCVTNFENNYYTAYGFNNGKWIESGCFYEFLIDDDIEATDKEVEEALIKEAKRRGFKNGVTFKSIYGNICTLNTEVDKFDFCLDALWVGINECGTNNEIFKNGVWAEIIETITKEEAEKKLGKKIV